MGSVKKLGQTVLGFAIMVGVFIVALLLLRGMVWVADKVLPWLMIASALAFCFCIVVLGPLSLFRKTQPWAGFAFYIISYLYGVMLFAFACIVTVELWGYVGLFIGLILAGVGVLPVAMLAALFKAQWALLLYIVIGIVLTFGTRGLGIYLQARAAKAAEQEKQLLFEQETTDVYEGR
jgi:hypothetical protein